MDNDELKLNNRDKISRTIMNGWNGNNEIDENINIFMSYLSSNKKRNGLPTRDSMIKEVVAYANKLNISLTDKDCESMIDAAKKHTMIITHNRDIIIITEKAKKFIKNKFQ